MEVISKETSEVAGSLSGDVVEVDGVSDGMHDCKQHTYDISEPRDNRLDQTAASLPVKTSAQAAMYLCMSTALSKGKKVLRKVSLSWVMVLRHMVTSSEEYVNIMAEAAPRVTVTPYPAIRRSPECSRSTE